MIRCHCCGANAVHGGDTFLSCLMCGEVIRDEPTLAEKWISNAMGDTDDEGQRNHFTDRLAPIEAPAEVTARVLVAIRLEAARG